MRRYRCAVRGRQSPRMWWLCPDPPTRPLGHADGRSRGNTFARIAGVMGLGLGLSGCLDLIKPDLALDIPGSYRTPHGPAEVATPTLDWWRSFRSRELTALMEEAQAANLDIAVAMAQIYQADAQVRIAGAPLLPNLSL